MEQSIRILLAEDDMSLGYVVKDNLQQSGFDVVLCNDGDEALRAFDSNVFDLCLLDVMMPKKDGFAVAEEIRKKNTAIPIVFLTAKAMIDDKVKAYSLGADEYITKPFDYKELRLRIQAILKRSGQVKHVQKKKSTYDLGKFTFDSDNYCLKLGEEVFHKLTKKENKILLELCHHLNEIVQREHILKVVWGKDDYFSGRSMDVFISKLRKYLKDDASIQIENLHGVGFKLSVH